MFRNLILNNISKRAYNTFSKKHIGINNLEIQKMLSVINISRFEDLIEKSTYIKSYPNLKLETAKTEVEANLNLKNILNKNIDNKSLIGLGYHNSHLPFPIKRHILQNPKWYTAYTPYQSEISQGRLESQYNFQTVIKSLTGLPVSNASLLDEGSAAAEVLSMCFNYSKEKKNKFLVCDSMHPQILSILETKAKNLNIELIKCDFENFDIENLESKEIFGIMFQYPNTYGEINIPYHIIDYGKVNNIPLISSCDILSLSKLITPAELGIDICFGTSQRLGVPLWFGGPHPAYLATSNKFIRHIPGRIIGKTTNDNNEEVFRLALQTREQHIKKDKATSNICTSQSLLTNVVAMYSIYHGPDGFQEIYKSINTNTRALKKFLDSMFIGVKSKHFFDTVHIEDEDALNIYNNLKKHSYLCRYINDREITISLDETITEKDLVNIFNIIKLSIHNDSPKYNESTIKNIKNHAEDFNYLPNNLYRKTEFFEEDLFNKYRNETQLMRYIHKLSNKDYTLCEGMIPLGSCTMKLNSVSQLDLLTDDKVTNFHPYTPENFIEGYLEMIEKVGDYLKKITGFSNVTFQPNAGSMGEYTGLLMIKKYFEINHDLRRNLCLIPKSAHGTNSASAKLANFDIKYYDDTIDIIEFDNLVSNHKDEIACIMITYPGTNGIFKNDIKSTCDIIHKYGGLVYIDGANMNALVGLVNLDELGADVCHLNLHKTFTIPHGGGGPGMGPVLCNNKLEEYLPNNIFQDKLHKNSVGMVTSSLWSSASLLTIPYMYISMMSNEGLLNATKIAILNSNYLKSSLENDYKIIDTNHNGFVGHEFIIDISEFKKIGISEKDISKRLIDYSFHPPTMSWPRQGILMFEPTESESKEELDRLIVALKSIRKELREIENNSHLIGNNLLTNSPHPISLIKHWKHDYSMKKAFFPVKSLEKNKFWPSVERLDDAKGDRELLKL